MAKKVVIIDYGMGNIASVKKAFEKIGASVSVAGLKNAILRADFLVLPGVGAFGDGMANLRARGLIETLTDRVIHRETPFLGICLGMQLLAGKGYEFGEYEGLGWLEGKVIRLNPGDLRIPHIGWNEITHDPKDRLFKNLPDKNFYFDHSYYFDGNIDLATSFCNYGIKFISSVQKNNIFATQFHPEKSQKSGLQFLNNFLNLSDG